MYIDTDNDLPATIANESHTILFLAASTVANDAFINDAALSDTYKRGN